MIRCFGFDKRPCTPFPPGASVQRRVGGDQSPGWGRETQEGMEIMKGISASGRPWEPIWVLTVRGIRQDCFHEKLCETLSKIKAALEPRIFIRSTNI